MQTPANFFDMVNREVISLQTIIALSQFAPWSRGSLNLTCDFEQSGGEPLRWLSEEEKQKNVTKIVQIWYFIDTKKNPMNKTNNDT